LSVTSGGLIRFALGGEWMSFVALLAAAAFAPSLALALGAWTGSAKTFEVLYLLLWYMGPMNRIPPIDFVGTTQPGAGPGSVITFMLLAAGLLCAAVVGRRRQIRT
jgi:MYXO-CTERM domain-containing protein